MGRFRCMILKNGYGNSSPRYSWQAIPCDDYPTRIVGCVAIAFVTAGLLWTYGFVIHPVTEKVWSLSETREPVTSGHASVKSVSTALPAPEPDMDSAAVRFANSDVVGPSGQVSSANEIEHSPKAGAVAAVSPKLKPKPKSRLAKKLPAEARNAFASHYRARAVYTSGYGYYGPICNPRFDPRCQ